MPAIALWGYTDSTGCYLLTTVLPHSPSSRIGTNPDGYVTLREAQMAKKRDRLGEDERWRTEPEEAYGGDPGTLTPTDERVASFANAEMYDDTLYPWDGSDYRGVGRSRDGAGSLRGRIR